MNIALSLSSACKDKVDKRWSHVRTLHIKRNRRKYKETDIFKKKIIIKVTLQRSTTVDFNVSAADSHSCQCPALVALLSFP